MMLPGNSKAGQYINKLFCLREYTKVSKKFFYQFLFNYICMLNNILVVQYESK